MLDGAALRVMSLWSHRLSLTCFIIVFMNKSFLRACFDLIRLSWPVKFLFVLFPLEMDSETRTSTKYNESQAEKVAFEQTVQRVLTLIFILMCSQVWQDSVSKGNPGQDDQQMQRSVRLLTYHLSICYFTLVVLWGSARSTHHSTTLRGKLDSNRPKHACRGGKLVKTQSHRKRRTPQRKASGRWES